MEHTLTISKLATDKRIESSVSTNNIIELISKIPKLIEKPEIQRSLFKSSPQLLSSLFEAHPSFTHTFILKSTNSQFLNNLSANEALLEDNLARTRFLSLSEKKLSDFFVQPQQTSNRRILCEFSKIASTEKFLSVLSLLGNSLCQDSNVQERIKKINFLEINEFIKKLNNPESIKRLLSKFPKQKILEFKKCVEQLSISQNKPEIITAKDLEVSSQIVKQNPKSWLPQFSSNTMVVHTDNHTLSDKTTDLLSTPAHNTEEIDPSIPLRKKYTSAYASTIDIEAEQRPYCIIGENEKSVSGAARLIKNYFDEQKHIASVSSNNNPIKNSNYVSLPEQMNESIQDFFNKHAATYKEPSIREKIIGKKAEKTNEIIASEINTILDENKVPFNLEAIKIDIGDDNKLIFAISERAIEEKITQPKKSTESDLQNKSTNTSRHNQKIGTTIHFEPYKSSRYDTQPEVFWSAVRQGQLEREKLSQDFAKFIYAEKLKRMDAAHLGFSHYRKMYPGSTEAETVSNYNRLSKELAKNYYLNIYNLSDESFISEFRNLITGKIPSFVKTQNKTLINELLKYISDDKEELINQLVKKYESRTGRLSIITSPIRNLFGGKLPEECFNVLEEHYKSIKQAQSDKDFLNQFAPMQANLANYKKLIEIYKVYNSDAVYKNALGERSYNLMFNIAYVQSYKLANRIMQVYEQKYLPGEHLNLLLICKKMLSEFKPVKEFVQTWDNSHVIAKIGEFIKNQQKAYNYDLAVKKGLNSKIVPYFKAYGITADFFTQTNLSQEHEQTRTKVINLANEICEFTSFEFSPKHKQIAEVAVQSIKTSIELCKADRVEKANAFLQFGHHLLKFTQGVGSGVFISLRDTGNALLHPIDTTKHFAQTVAWLATTIFENGYLDEGMYELLQDPDYQADR